MKFFPRPWEDWDMARRPRVALLVESSRAYGRGLLHGIAEYVRLHGPWSIYLAERGLGEAPPGWLKGWKGDGIIARIENRRIARAVSDLGLPTVDLRGLFTDLGVPRIVTDDQAVARLAVEHFLERGFRHFAFCGFPGADYSDQRSQGFTRSVEEAGFACHVYQSSRLPPAAGTEVREQWGWMTEAEVADWIEGLPKPVGLMACNDIRAQQLLSACRAIGAAVPDEVAVLGVDNDEVLCDLSDPPLSSIIPDTHRIGHEAAARLESLMRGEASQAVLTVIPPLGIVTRRSTDVLAVDDRAISRAAHFIREHACEPITIQDVLADLPLSRSVFERRFAKTFGRTPKAEILRTRLERVKRLLAETDWPLKQIASKAGFDHPEYLCVAFKKRTGQTPGEYRRSAQQPR
jgi:LacI family transcriptional regulator, galactose operon repressor